MRTLRLSTLALPALALALAAAACASPADDPGPGSGSGGTSHPTGPDDLVLRMDIPGSFVPTGYVLRHLPGFSLFGDGRTVTEGPQIEIYPGPALPNLLARQLDEDGIQAILDAARDAGLFGPDRHYDNNCIADAGTTTFTLVAEGERHVISAYALGMAEGSGCGLSEEELADLRRLVEFSSKLFDLSWLPAGSVGEEEPFAFAELRVFVTPYVPSEEPELEQPQMAWPVSTPLVEFGAPVPNQPEMRCGSVNGDDLPALRSSAQQANELTPWTSGGDMFGLAFRPLLPDESGCEGLDA